MIQNKVNFAMSRTQYKFTRHVSQQKKRLMQERCQLIETYLEIIGIMGFSRSFKSDYTYAYKYNDKYKYNDRNK